MRGGEASRTRIDSIPQFKLSCLLWTYAFDWIFNVGQRIKIFKVSGRHEYKEMDSSNPRSRHWNLILFWIPLSNNYRVRHTCSIRPTGCFLHQIGSCRALLDVCSTISKVKLFQNVLKYKIKTICVFWRWSF